MGKKLFVTWMLAAFLGASMVCSAEEAQVETELQTEEAVEQAAVNLDRPEYKALDHVTLGEYKGLSVVRDMTTEGIDAIVDAEIQAAIREADALEKVTEGKAADTDTVVIDYEGTVNGESFVGGSAKGMEVVIGSGTLIDGFEKGLIGMAPGETKTLNLTFPKDYISPDLAGQKAEYNVTLQSIRRVPELTGELVNQISEGQYSEPENYRNYIRSQVESGALGASEIQMKSDLLTQVAASSKIKSYPQEMVDYAVNNMKAYYEEYAEWYSMSFEEFLSDYLGMTEDEFQAEAEEAARQILQQELILCAIAEQENITVSDQEYADGCQKFAAEYNYSSADQLIAAYGEDTIRSSILQNKVLDYLLNNAVVTQVTDDTAEPATEAQE